MIKNKLKKGFTLVELIVVIAIIAILSTISVVGYTTYIKYANQEKVDSHFRNLDIAATGYQLTGRKDIEFAINKYDYNYSVRYESSEKTFYIDIGKKDQELTTAYPEVAKHIIFTYFKKALEADGSNLVIDIEDFLLDGNSFYYKKDDYQSNNAFTIKFD